MVADDNMNYLCKFIMLNSNEDCILIHNLHLLKICSAKKLIKEFPQRLRLRSLNYLLKIKAKQIDSLAENIDAVNDLMLSQSGWCVHQRHTNYR